MYPLSLLEDKEPLFLRLDLINTLSKNMKKPRSNQEVLKFLSQYDNHRISHIIDEISIYIEQKNLDDILIQPVIQNPNKVKTHKI